MVRVNAFKSYDGIGFVDPNATRRPVCHQQRQSGSDVLLLVAQ
jgi:hypothetical protein